MRTLRPLAVVPLLALGGCSLWGLRSGGDTEAVEASGPDLASAEKNAVASLFGLYLSSSAEASSRAVLDEKVLARAPAFIKKRDVLKASASKASIRALVRFSSLGFELERLGLDGGPGTAGRAKVLIELTEPGSWREGARSTEAPGVLRSPEGTPAREPGRASDALRRALVRRGFAAYDLSDGLDPAKRLGADILVKGTAVAEPVEDPRFSGPSGEVPGYKVFRGTLDVSAVRLSRDGEPLPVRVQATAVDLGEASARAKALENAGDMAGDSLAERMASSWKQEAELSVVVVGLRDLAAARRVIDDLRVLPDLSRVALVSHLPPETRLSVRTGLPADELASRVLGMRSYGFNVLAVGSGLVELEVLREPDEDL